MERNDRDLCSLSPHPTPFLPDSRSMASVCQHAEGNAAKQPEIEMITTSLSPSQAAPWKLIPTNKLLSTCWRGRESESNSMCWERKKGEKEMCGRVNVRSPNKLGLMTSKQVWFFFFFPTVFTANATAADLKNAINTIRRRMVRHALTYRVMIKWRMSGNVVKVVGFQAHHANDAGLHYDCERKHFSGGSFTFFFFFFTVTSIICSQQSLHWQDFLL